MALVRGCLEWIGRLQAEESLLETARIGTGTGSFKDAATGAGMIAQWKAVAKPNEPIPAARIETRKQQIKAAGLKVFKG